MPRNLNSANEPVSAVPANDPAEIAVDTPVKKERAKKRPNGTGSYRYNQKTGVWTGTMTFGYDSRTGKQIRRSLSGKKKSEVQKRLEEMKYEFMHRHGPEEEQHAKKPSNMTVGEYLDLWHEQYLPNLKVTTKQTYKNAIDHHLKPALGAIKLRDLDTLTIQSFLNLLTGPLSAKTVWNIYAVLHKALEKAVDTGLLPKDPSDACELAKKSKKEILTMTSEESQRFLEEAKEDIFYDLFKITLMTGMRQAELLGLSWEQVDFDRGRICICQQIQRCNKAYTIITPKHDKVRTITPAQAVMDTLKHIRHQQEVAEKESEGLWNNPDNLVFTNELGAPLVRRTVDKHFKKIAARIGLPNLRFHDLRHTNATLSLLLGDNIKSVSENLGHASPEFTLKVYAHVNEEMQQKSKATMDTLYELVKPKEETQNSAEEK